ncbi:MAG: hypothetical protein HYR91_14405 [Flavobacteriia bacterium]|nr:hypothetical protein [Flavobacteriia bacterium]
MKKLFYVVFVLLASNLMAQDSSKVKIGFIRFSEIATQITFSSEQNINGTIENFNSLFPNSKFSTINLSDYQQTINNSSHLNSMFSLQFGFQLANKNRSAYRENSLFRIGINHANGNPITYSNEKKTTIPFDTLTSAQTGQTTYLDSTYINNFDLLNTRKILKFDLSYLYIFHSSSRLSFKTGIGFTTGLMYDSQTKITHTKKERIESHTIGNNNDSFDSFSTKSTASYEVTSNKNSYAFSAYIPIGIDFRLGHKNLFLSKTHLFYELRADINLVNIPELKTFINPRTQHGIGLRFTF